MTKSAVRRFGAAVIPAFMLVACSDHQAADSGTGKQAQTEQVEIVIYSHNAGDKEEWMRNYGNPIQEQFPHIKIKVVSGSDKGSNIKDLVATNSQVDIVIASTSSVFPILLENGLQYDITGLIEKYNYDLNQLEPNLVETMRMIANGGLYGLPTNDNVVKLYYNKDLFDRFGVPYLKDGMTWDEVYDVAVKTTRMDNGIPFRGLVMHLGSLLDLNQYSANPLDPKTGSVLFHSDDKWKKIVTNIDRFYKITGNESIAGENPTNLFAKDRTAAMLVTYAQSIPNDFNWDMVQLPTFRDLPGVGSQNISGYWFVANSSKHKDEAFQVIAYITSKPFQKKFASITYGIKTVLKDKEAQQAIANAPFLKGKHIEAIFPPKMAAPSIITEYHSLALSQLSAEVNQVIQGKVDMNTALRNATEKAEKAVAEAKAAKGNR